jgi:hypothetical protein
MAAKSVDKERLLKYLSDLHARELNAYTGASSAGGPAFSPNVLVEVLGKVEAGNLDMGAGQVTENVGIVRSFVEGFTYLPRYFFKDMQKYEVARVIGIGLFILLLSLGIGALAVMVLWTVG